MEIIYTFYFFAFLKKVIKKLLTFCYWCSMKNNILRFNQHVCEEISVNNQIFYDNELAEGLF